MLDLQPMNSLVGQVQAPSYDALLDTKRRRDRRAGLLAAAGSIAVVLTLAVGALVVTHADDSSPEPVITPSPTPSPSPHPSPTHNSATSMTPREVVRADNARLELTGVSADDPDFRISIWQAECPWCPRVRDSRFPHPSFMGMAITSDGFATARYLRPALLELPEGGLRPIHVESPGPGLLLLIDGSNGGEWLVRDDGSVTRQARVSDAAPAADPRLWFVCLTNFDNPPGVLPDTPSGTWCSLEPRANVVHVMDSSWYGTDEIGDATVSVVNPGSGSPPWGIQNVSLDSLDVWWQAGGSRQVKDFGPASASGAISNGPPGLLSYWSWSKGSPTLSVFTSSDLGTSWQTARLRAPSRRIDPYAFDLSWTPGGALLGRQDDFAYVDGSHDEGDRVRLWRGASPDGGAFTPVYEAVSGGVPGGYDATPFNIIGGRIWSHGLSSDDDGLTWTEVTGWR